MIQLAPGLIVNPQKQLLDLDRADCEDSLYEFLRNAWKYIDASPWTDGWPIEAIAEHLQAVVDGDIRKLIINVPPRHGKSSICSVALPAWTWAQSHRSATSGPGVPFLMASYANQLVLRDSVKCRRLIESPWYQSMWGERFKLNSDQNTKSRFSNDQGGERLITSVSAAVTGEGGNIIVVDDPNAANEAFSEANIEATTEWWDGTLATRHNDPKTGAFIVIQQRLAEDDLTGHILEKNVGDWVHLCLPMKFEPERSVTTSIGWKDPRTEPGELLWPARFGPAEVDLLERQLGPYKSAGQLQQRPEPAGGGVIKREWWQPWDEDVFPPMDYILASLDTAYTTKQENDFSALTVWGVFTGDTKAVATRMLDAEGRPVYLDRSYSEGSPKVMLMGAWQERLELNALVEKVATTCKRLKCDLLLVENKAAGHSVGQELRRLYGQETWGVQLYDPKSIDKLSRLYSIQHLFSEGMVYAPDKAFADMVITQVGSFPKGRHDDLCFVAGTMIATRGGNQPIETIAAGDEVLTPAGWRKVLAAGPTGEQPVVSRFGLTGTGAHPVFTLEDGWERLDTVTQDKTLSRLTLCSLTKTILQNAWSSTASSTDEWAASACTTYPRPNELKTGAAQKDCTSPSGSISLVSRFLRSTTCITETATRSTAALGIWSAYQWACIGACLRTSIWRSSARTLLRPDLSPQLGTGQKKAGLGTVKSQPRGWWQRAQLSWQIPYRTSLGACADGAGGLSASRSLGSNTAEPHASCNSLHTDGGSENTLTPTTRLVYNLTVDDAHCYYANGILVHNCDTVSQALRHLRDLGLLERGPERLAELEQNKHHFGRGPEPLYPA